MLRAAVVPQEYDFHLFEIAGTPISVATVGAVVGIGIATIIVSRLVRRTIELGLRRQGVKAEGTIAVVSRLTHYLVLFIGFGVAIQTAGIDVGTLFAAGAVFAVGLGFAMQNIAQNFVSGVILLVERAIKPGDILKVEGRIVRVLEMGIRSTIVESRDGEELIVPNSVIAQGTVVNYTFHDSIYRVRVRVGVKYSSDMELVKATLEKVVAELSQKWGKKSERPHQVLMAKFSDHSVEWEVAIWMHDPWIERFALAEIHESIWWAFKREGIEIAFPQLDLHLDPRVEQALGARAD